MSMVIYNNMGAIKTLNNLNKNTTQLAKDLQKVSSGMRINSASDGASEYAIGKRMDVMIRSLGQDIDNTKTGRELVKTAEGGIQNIIENLRDMKEMAINSANDTNTDLDREIIQKDFSARMQQITEIAATTNYNGRLLLNGDYYEPRTSTGQTTSTGNDGKLNKDNSVTGLFQGMPIVTMNKSGVASWANGLPAYTGPGGTQIPLDFTNTTASSIADMDQQGFVLLCTASGCPAYCGFKFDASMPAGTGIKTGGTARPTYVVGIEGINSFDELAKALYDGVQAAEGGSGDVIALSTSHRPTLTKIGDKYTISYGFSVYIYEGEAGDPDNPVQPKPTTYEINEPGNPLIIHTGTKANQHLRVFINSMHPIAMGLNRASVNPREKAVAALGIVDKAINYALNEITRMGAYQVRLDETEDTLVTQNENTQASESTLCDADMAKEMTNYTKNGVLTQAAQSMLSQANQQSSSILDLLK